MSIIGLSGGSKRLKEDSKTEKKKRVVFVGLQAKYRKEGAAKKKDELDSDAALKSSHMGNVQSSSMSNSSVEACYPLGLTSSCWSWSYFYYYPTSGHANMWLHPYFQYHVAFPYYGAS